MNQRIQKLMQQSMVEYQYDLRFSPEKFAELIIAECASIVRDTNLEDVEGGDSAVLNAASDQLKEFFKV